MLKIINTDQFEMQGTKGRFIHCATVHNTAKFKEYIFFYDTLTNKKYIEEITGGTLREIPDDDLWNDLVEYAVQYNLFPAVINKNVGRKK